MSDQGKRDPERPAALAAPARAAPAPPRPNQPTPAERRNARLATALRANLRRRKDRGPAAPAGDDPA